MGEWIISLEGTAQGHKLALSLALMAAFLHALFGALQKGRHDPWLSRAAIDGCYGLVALVLAIFVVPFPEPHMWVIFAGAFVIHTFYKLFQASTYQRGAYTVVYPIVRGTSPLFAVFAAGIVFGETFTPGQWIGLVILLLGIFGLSAYNLIHTTSARESLIPALWLAFATGGCVAAYTTYDAYGIRATYNPFTFIVWLFLIDSWFMPVVTFRRWRRLPVPEIKSLIKLGVLGMIVSYLSFGSIMLATRIDNVGEVAVLRETSTVFAALIGWLVLGDKVGFRRLALMALIAAGAVIVESAG